MPIFKGAGVAIVTPMKDNLEVNYDKLDEILEEQIAGKTMNCWRETSITRLITVQMPLLLPVQPVRVQLYPKKNIKKL